MQRNTLVYKGFPVRLARRYEVYGRARGLMTLRLDFS